MNHAALHQRLWAAATCFDAACALADAWLERPAGHPSPADGLGDGYLAWGDRVQQIGAAFAARADGTLNDADRDMLVEATDSEIDAVHAVCWGLDLATWPSYTTAWAAAHGGAWEPADGDWFPVVDWPDTDAWALSTRPSALLADPDQFPHLRQYRTPTGPEGVAIRFDPSAWAALEGALSRLGTAATIHPNLSLDELDIPAGPLVFPVAPNHRDQPQIVTAMVRSALDAGAAIVVVPELAVTPATIEALLQLIDNQWEPVIVTAGSQHTTDNRGRPVNESVTLLPEIELTARKMVPFTQHVGRGRPSKEAIAPVERTITVHIAGRWRFATVICKDLLDTAVTDALAYTGVNAVIAPAFSDRTDDYIAVAADLVRRTQGMVVMANNPARFTTQPVVPAAVVGQPVAGAYTQTWPEPGQPRPDQRGTVVFDLGSASPSWHPLTQNYLTDT